MTEPLLGGALRRAPGLDRPVGALQRGIRGFYHALGRPGAVLKVEVMVRSPLR